MLYTSLLNSKRRTEGKILRLRLFEPVESKDFLLRMGMWIGSDVRINTLQADDISACSGERRVVLGLGVEY